MVKPINKTHYLVALAGSNFLLILLLLAILPTKPSFGAPLRQSTVTPVVYLPIIDPGPNAPAAQSTNQPPSVDAGAAQTITVADSLSLFGTVTDDGLPNPPGSMNFTWSKISGPGEVIFSSPTTKTTTAIFTQAGVYILQLMADDGEKTANDQVTITVHALNQSPTVQAGDDQTITLPNSAQLNGTVRDDGLPNPPAQIITTWSKSSGPGDVTFADVHAEDTTATFSQVGVYVLQLDATDSVLTVFDSVLITVKEVATDKRIAFTSRRDGNDEIYVMNGDGTGQTRLTNNVAVDMTPAWSPDGSKIAFVSDRDGNSEIYVMNSDGSEVINLTNNVNADEDPSWAPDGKKIVFSSNRDGNDEIYVMSADGTEQIRLTNEPKADYHPDWSPDGTKIAFTTSRDGRAAIYTMNSDGSSPVKLVGSIYGDFYPTWSPDGTKIAFVTNSVLFPDGRYYFGEIMVMNADGSNPVDVTNEQSIDITPSWSPDGKKIIFETRRVNGSGEIFAINADGSTPTNLTNNRAHDWAPAWQR